jgi:hypothetical protein
VIDDDDAVVFCPRADDRGLIPVHGSLIRACRCLHDVWVAPSTIERTAGYRLVLVCRDCITETERDELTRFVIESPPADVLTPRMVAEIRQHRQEHPEHWRSR